MRYFFLMIVTAAVVTAQTITLKYDLDVSMFGTVGYADIVYSEDTDRYRMEAGARAIDSVAALTKNYTETYVSEGRIVNGRYVPETFTKIKRTDDEFNRERYEFDHANRQVRKIRHLERKERSTKFNVMTMKLERKVSTKVEDHNDLLDRYAGDDPLSTFLNARAVLKDEKSDIRIDAIAIKQKDTAIISKLLQNTLRVTVKDFGGGDDVLVNVELDEDYMVKSATAEDVLLFGDFRINRLYRHVGSL